MDILQDGHGEDGEDAEPDLQVEGSLRCFIRSLDVLMGKGGAVGGKLVKCIAQFFAGAVDRIIDLVEFGIGRSLLNQCDEIDLDRLAHFGDIGVVVLQQVGIVHLAGMQTYVFRAIG